MVSGMIIMIDDFKKNIITKEDFDNFLKQMDNNTDGEWVDGLGADAVAYYEGRWEYYNEIINQLNEMDDINSVLEIGPYKLPFVKESDIIDYSDEFVDSFPFEVGEFIVHDCTQFPLPIEDKKYDLVLACQVIEHLGIFGEQIELFNELERISNKALISLPFHWYRARHRDHHMIDRRMIDIWAGGRRPTFEFISGKRNEQRILQLYEFDKQVEAEEDYLKKIIDEDQEMYFKPTRVYRRQENKIKKWQTKHTDLLERYKQVKKERNSLTHKLETQKHNNEQLKKKVEQFRCEKRELQAQIKTMENTTSWKITRPIRVIKSKFK